MSRLQGYSRLIVDATAGLTDVVEAMHHTISQAPGILDAPPKGGTTGITGIVYNSIRAVTGLVGGGLDLALEQMAPLVGPASTSPGHELALAVLNGVVGDMLAERKSPLAIPMEFRYQGQTQKLTPEAWSAAIPKPNGKLLVLVHGLCMNDQMFARDGHEHGSALAAALGYTPVYVNYNSGRHISTNGREFAEQLEQLIASWPVPIEEFSILAFSMGGLVIRSAGHYAEQAGHHWPRQLKQIVYLGAPHDGAPMERGGNWLTMMLGASPYTAPFTKLAKIRSAGITDLRHGYLLDEDWNGHDRFVYREGVHHRHVPLMKSVRHVALGATLGKREADLSDRLIGDGLVPLDSSLGRHALPERALPFDRTWIGYGMNHLGLISREEVYEEIRRCFDSTRSSREDSEEVHS